MGVSVIAALSTSVINDVYTMYVHVFTYLLMPISAQ